MRTDIRNVNIKRISVVIQIKTREVENLGLLIERRDSGRDQLPWTVDSHRSPFCSDFSGQFSKIQKVVLLK